MMLNALLNPPHFSEVATPGALRKVGPAAAAEQDEADREALPNADEVKHEPAFESILPNLRWYTPDELPELLPTTSLRELMCDAIAYPEMGMGPVDDVWCRSWVLLGYEETLFGVSAPRCGDDDGARTLAVFVCLNDLRLQPLQQRRVAMVSGVAVWPLVLALGFTSIEVVLHGEGRLALSAQRLQRLTRSAITRDPASLRVIKDHLPPAMMGNILSSLF